MSKIQLNTKELKEEIRDVIRINRKLQEDGDIPVTIGIEGHAGIGKTSCVFQAAMEEGIDPRNIVRVNLAEVEELGDLVGIPLKEFEVCKDGGDCEWINEHLIETYVTAGYKVTGNKRMTYALPDKINGKGENGVLILDDYTRKMLFI